MEGEKKRVHLKTLHDFCCIFVKKFVIVHRRYLHSKQKYICIKAFIHRASDHLHIYVNPNVHFCYIRVKKRHISPYIPLCDMPFSQQTF